MYPGPKPVNTLRFHKIHLLGLSYEEASNSVDVTLYSKHLYLVESWDQILNRACKSPHDDVNVSLGQGKPGEITEGCKLETSLRLRSNGEEVQKTD